MKTKKINAFLLVTHLINDEILNRYHKLQREVKGLGELFLLLHREADSAESTQKFPPDIIPYIFNTDTLNELEYEPIAETITPGSNHFATLQFFLDNPGFEYYWVIEYDVVYKGNWSYLFQNFDSQEADFISSNIRRFSDMPGWYWWNSLHLENMVDERQLIRSLNPICRLSKRALILLNTLLKGRLNWGHHEVLIPTVLRQHGLEILDFGGDGEFVLPGFKDKFYISPSQHSGGTVRYAPPISRGEFRTKNRLYHPVKTTP